VPHNDIVILIDCWADGPTALRGQMCQNIRTAIDQIKPRLAVLATYESSEIFDPGLTHNQWISAFWNRFPDFEDALIEGSRATHPSIMDLRLDCEQVAATRWWQFQYLLDRMDRIPDRIWFFGLHWNICLRDRELGWHNIRYHFKHNTRHDTDIMFRDDCSLQIPYYPNTPSLDTSQDLIKFETWPDIVNDTATKCELVDNHVWRLT